MTIQKSIANKKKWRECMEKMFMRVEEVMAELGVSETYAYKLIRKLNKELMKTGCVTIAGRIDRKFFYEHFYGTQQYEGRD